MISKNRGPAPGALLPLGAALAALAACSGPQLHLHNVGGHRVFVDGLEVPSLAPIVETGEPDSVEGSAEGPVTMAAPSPGTRSDDSDQEAPYRTTLPFRYYGTTRWDALPTEELQDGIPVFAARPASQEVEITPPASLWLFPLDFPIELVSRMVTGRGDQTATVTVVSKPPGQREDREIPAADIGKLRERARQARIAR